MSDSRLIITTCNHFDPIWRRCFDRTFEYDGQTFASYADLEEYYIEDNLAIARENPEYKFDVEAVVVLRKYLERHPERLPELRALCDAGRFGVCGAGDNVIDVNMVLGESIIRNFLYGQLWLEKMLNFTPRLATRRDGFGNCAQLPQVLKGCEFEALTDITYTYSPKPFWRGMDGSTIRLLGLPAAAGSSPFTKYSPCTDCAGKGCPTCEGRGIEDLVTDLPGTPDAEVITGSPLSRVRVGPEEMLPNPAIVQWAQEHGAEFGLEEDNLRLAEEALETDDESQIFAGELNPNNSGCWVTRIKTKQQCRRQEHELLGLEALLALAGRGAIDAANKEVLQSAWDDLLLTMFHDSITATHIDAAYDEIRDLWANIDESAATLRGRLLETASQPSQVVTTINASGFEGTTIAEVELDDNGPVALTCHGQAVPVLDAIPSGEGKQKVRFAAPEVPAYGKIELTISEGEAPIWQKLDQPVIENGRYRVTADENGILEIYDKQLQRSITRVGDYRPAEIVLERDYGSPWATLWADRTRAGMAKDTKLVRAEAISGQQRFVFEGVSDLRILSNQSRLHFTLTVTVTEGIDRVEFKMDCNWNAHSARVRIALPLSLGGQGIYGVPYGMLARDEYEPDVDKWDGANGDWPAINWAGVEGDGLSVAFLSKGLPSYCTETDDNGLKSIFLSVLRSPMDGTYLNEPQFYHMPEYMGMRDVGDHSFEFAIGSYDCAFADSSVMGDAAIYSAGLLSVPGDFDLPQGPSIDSSVAAINNIKPAEDGSGLVLRIWEYRGKGGEAVIALPGWLSKAKKVNMMERDGDTLAVRNGAVTLRLKPWEIATVKLN